LFGNNAWGLPTRQLFASIRMGAEVASQRGAAAKTFG
jgi:hypothetical protein